MHRHTALISEKAERYIKILSEHFRVIPLPPDDMLDAPVACHADMTVFTLGDTAVLPSEYAREYPSLAKLLREDCGMTVMTCDGERGKRYPQDVSLNVLLCGGYAFSLKAHTSATVSAILREKGITHVDVKQGYAACSSLAVDGGVITADPSIAAAADSAGLDVLRITSGHIRLEGYNEGFIGGASGVCGRTVYFLGNIMTHPDEKNIREFLTTHGYSIVCLGDGELEDFGGIRFL